MERCPRCCRPIDNEDAVCRFCEEQLGETQRDQERDSPPHPTSAPEPRPSGNPADEGQASPRDRSTRKSTKTESNSVWSIIPGGGTGYVHPIVAGATGAFIVTILAPFTFPTVALGTGAIAAIFVVRTVDDEQLYAWTGTVFLLFTAVGITVASVDAVYEQTVVVSLIGLGLVSVTVLIIRRVIAEVLSYLSARTLGTGEDEEIGQTGASLTGLLTVSWTVIMAKERIARSTIVGLLAPTTLILDLTGVTMEVPGFWIVTHGIDLNLFVFIGAIIIGFHTLASWYAVFQFRNTETGQKLEARTRTAAREATERQMDTMKSAQTSVAESGTEQLDQLRERATEGTQDITRQAKEASRTVDKNPATYVPGTQLSDSDEESRLSGIKNRLNSITNRSGERGNQTDTKNQSHQPRYPPEPPSEPSDGGSGRRGQNFESHARDPTDHSSNSGPDRQNQGATRQEIQCQSCGTPLDSETGRCPRCGGGARNPTK